MKSKYHIINILIVVASCAYGAYECDFETIASFGSVTVTPTNMAIKFKKSTHMVMPDADAVVMNPVGDYIKPMEAYMENDEALILTPDKRTRMYQYSSGIMFSPVVFKNGLKGFRIHRGSMMSSTTDRVGGATNDVWFVALSDVFVEVGEDDVEMIMGYGWGVERKEGKEWRPFTEADRIRSFVSNLEGLIEAAKHDPEARARYERYLERTGGTAVELPPLPSLPLQETDPEDELSPPPVIASVPATQPNPEPVTAHTPVIARSEATKQPSTRIYLYTIPLLLLAIVGTLLLCHKK